MITISKPKLLAVFIILVIAGGSFYAGRVFSIPAANINSICEPGACTAQACTYYIYKNQITANDNTTYAKNCVTGANDFSGSDSAALLQSVFTFLGTVPAYGLIPPTGIAPGPQFSILFGVGEFYIPRTVIINLPITTGDLGSGGALTLRGQGEDKTGLILSANTNNWMFNVTNMGDKFQIESIKFFGNSLAQNAHGSGIFYFSGRELENIWSHVEMRNCVSACVDFAGNGGQWNVFTDVWMLGGPRGFQIDGTGYSDWRFVGCKFDNMNGGAIRFNVPASIITITGSNFVSSGLFFNNQVKGLTVVGNIFTGIRDQTIFFGNSGLASLTNYQTLISANVFNETTTPTHRAIYLSNFVDGVTITSNSFSGYSSASLAIPVALVNTNQKLTTLVTQNSGMGSAWTGFGITQPAVPASTVNQQNNNPYQVRIYIAGVGSGITAYKVTDPSGTSNTFTTAVTVGYTIELDPYAQVAMTYTGSPTWVWFGEANLS